MDDLDNDWALVYLGQNDSDRLAELSNSLSRDIVHNKGEGKKIHSGFSYWGVGPSEAWVKVIQDPNYKVMHESIENFKDILNERVIKDFQRQYGRDINFDYVSLGSGTGEKDYHILTSELFKQDNFYYPVDMSYALLRHNHSTNRGSIRRSQTLPLQIDISNEFRLSALRKAIDNRSKNNVLFGILGNTLSNFESSLDQLKLISDHLLREGDFILLEIAWIKNITKESRELAKESYNIESFKKFVASALLQNTNLYAMADKIDINSYTPDDDKEKSIKIRFYHRNTSEKDINVTIVGGTDFLLKPDDTIGLHLTRKFTDDGIENLIAHSGLNQVYKRLQPQSDNDQFGIMTLLLRKNG